MTLLGRGLVTPRACVVCLRGAELLKLPPGCTMSWASRYWGAKCTYDLIMSSFYCAAFAIPK